MPQLNCVLVASCYPPLRDERAQAGAERHYQKSPRRSNIVLWQVHPVPSDSKILTPFFQYITLRQHTIYLIKRCLAELSFANALNAAMSEWMVCPEMWWQRLAHHHKANRETPSSIFPRRAPNTSVRDVTPVDDLAAELFAMTLTDNEAIQMVTTNFQRGKANAHLDAELTGNDT
ncbi:hypothetical protein DFJ58DRAFT_846704 [Suillus subalutaceus]|uniref:uncharacterized protein n=1 Tax=Suillus subalutaceus TaxID=48586 RepID=UPI001B871944|nr:uncharacterized protein DFJ58DRAFT_846704 [Suillus subalutaceus]KAG1836958.1 hypothetical protein DFJ58DRAFT_846704 [Suillus subalutaceus]